MLLLLVNKKKSIHKKFLLHLAVRYGCEHTHTSEREPYVPYVVGTQGVHTHTAREETLRAVRRGCWVTHTFSRSRIVFLHALRRMCDYGSTGQSAECQCAHSESLVRATLPTGPMIYV